MILKQCIVCNCLIKFNQDICENCQRLLDKELLSSFLIRCPVCNYPLLSTEYECVNCKHENSISIFSLMDYHGTICNSLIKRFKFKYEIKLSCFIAKQFEFCISYLDPTCCAILVPVPCSYSSLKSRGWDQMQVISAKLNRKCINAVINVSCSNIQQKSLNRKEREDNSSKKYAINPDLTAIDMESLLNGKIIIIDDIMTTGETIYAVSNILKNVGIKNICAATWLYDI